MKVNKNDLQKLASKNDSELWEEIRAIASKHGYTLPTGMPTHTDMEKIRAAMLGIEKINLTEAMRIINTCKKKEQ